eukprot:2942714-Ditylum_brightwellii.AAC.1
MDPHYPKLYQLYIIKINKVRGHVVDADHIHAAPIVSLQHLFVTALPSRFGEAIDNGDGGKHVAYKKHVDENAAATVEE